MTDRRDNVITFKVCSRNIQMHKGNKNDYMLRPKGPESNERCNISYWTKEEKQWLSTGAGRPRYTDQNAYLTFGKTN